MMSDSNVSWIGDFTAADREAINGLRAGQVSAIKSGNADVYAALCADDIALMLPGNDVVIGREDFRRVEADLLGKIRVEKMEQNPIRIERDGDLAVELGRQLFTMTTGESLKEKFTGRRKYCHILRRTKNGWRFSVLMSNNSE